MCSNWAVLSGQVNTMAYYAFQNDTHENCNNTCVVYNVVLRKSLCRDPRQDFAMWELEMERPGRSSPEHTQSSPVHSTVHSTVEECFVFFLLCKTFAFKGYLLFSDCRVTFPGKV